MSIIVTDNGFAEDEVASGAFTVMSLEQLRTADISGLPGAIALCVDNDTDPDSILPLPEQVALVSIAFPSFADGRGFSLARRLRQAGYTGRLRAEGHLIADQYGQARRVGFDEVAISDEIAARQPEEQWLARAEWQNHFYQMRLQTSARTF
ncbi:DUF934 domain-containing protein [Oricola thermophila]|uniref:DUF934 domain-containing protein n=1 Tax=Oricola thermophila TaxID=2742145 RepID=A0A6N1VGP0_9HYPH|nr:DUF934 domain-containing protein [Oricola thermophila]QKV18835.1 DUF934 domain-containing protein [Oricola thermophila]